MAGSSIGIQWTAANVVSGSKISLCYDIDTTFNGNEHWIEIDGVTASNSGGTYTWNTTGVAAGTYYLAGYMYDGSQDLHHLAPDRRQSPLPTAASCGRHQTFAVTGPTSGSYQAGQTVGIQWTAGNVVAGSTISLCYDSDATFNGNEHWIEIDGVAASNSGGTYSWNTTGVAAGTYYLAGYMYDGKALHVLTPWPGDHDYRPRRRRRSRLPARPPARYVAGSSVGIQWTAANVVAGSKISLCYDADTTYQRQRALDRNRRRGRLQQRRHVHLEYHRRGGRHLLPRRLHV